MTAGPLRKAVARDLRRLKATSSVEGQLALALAARLDDVGTPASAVPMAARELRELLRSLRGLEKPKEVSPLDEIRKRRERRVRRADS